MLLSVMSRVNGKKRDHVSVSSDLNGLVRLCFSLSFILIL